MATQSREERDHEWLDYYERFSYFSPQKVRDGCYPRVMEHPASEKAIVLVHGLTDSPYFMTAIGDYFFRELKYNVYMPLLHCHGLKEPKGMEGVELEEWKANVSFAIKTAASRSEQISVGGLSTGGALSFYMAATNPSINGALYLDGYNPKNPFPVRVFAAHSEPDTTADIAGIERLKKVSISDHFHFFRIPEKFDVPHASVVLKEPISIPDEELERKNPLFQK